jgi:antitoxin PrlF
MKVKLTREGQVTIPATVQQQLGLQAGDELLLIFTGTEIRLRVIKSRRLSEFYGVLPTTSPIQVEKPFASKLQRLERGRC